MMDAKEALKELEDLTVDYGDRNEEQIARLDEAIDMAMDALRNLPNRLRQAMDTINRKEAIDEVCKAGCGSGFCGVECDEVLALRNMPSAQPETHEERTETHACDCIERQAAIELADTLKDDVTDDERIADAVIAHNEGILEYQTALSLLPSAQPVDKDTNVPCKDAISRQTAIDVLKNRWKKTRNYEGNGDDIAEECELYLKQVPSAQPEIVRCKDCKHWKDSDGVYRRGINAESKCPVNIRAVYEGNFYCADAERRTDG